MTESLSQLLCVPTRQTLPNPQITQRVFFRLVYPFPRRCRQTLDLQFDFPSCLVDGVCVFHLYAVRLQDGRPRGGGVGTGFVGVEELVFHALDIIFQSGEVYLMAMSTLSGLLPSQPTHR